MHIYRLVSERTVEENILKKANQKRLLGDLAIEGGNFTTAQLKTQTIKELFNVEQKSKEKEDEDGAVVAVVKASSASEKRSIGAFESAIAAVEDATDKEVNQTKKHL